MITDELVANQVSRISGLNRYPRTKEGLRSLCEACQQTFQSEDELCQAIDDILRTRPDCPRPCEIYISARQSAPNVGCATCAGTGFVFRKRRCKTIDGLRETDWAHTCECRKAAASSATVIGFRSKKFPDNRVSDVTAGERATQPGTVRSSQEGGQFDCVYSEIPDKPECLPAALTNRGTKSSRERIFAA